MRVTCKMASCSASLPGSPPSTIAMYFKAIVWYPCTPSSTRKTCGKICKKNSASTGPGINLIKEIVGLLKNEAEDDDYDDSKIVKLRSSRFSRANVEAGTGDYLWLDISPVLSSCW